MNDRFKFRVWKKASKKMYNVKRIGFNDVDFKTSTICVDITNNGIRGALLESADEYILMQCTGLKDKNGKLIYEGDIISGINGSINGSGMEFKTIIKWNNDNCCFNTPKFGSNENSTHWYEIIGNIYENPELLEVK